MGDNSKVKRQKLSKREEKGISKLRDLLFNNTAWPKMMSSPLFLLALNEIFFQILPKGTEACNLVIW